MAATRRHDRGRGWQACCVPLIMQHWFVLARYVSNNLYVCLMLLTEAFFEWTVLSNWECS